MRTRFAVCVENEEYPASPERFKIYRALTDKGALAEGYVRIIYESGEDYLYPETYFILIDLPQETERALRDWFARDGAH
jgi:hypothetical protein